jgi:hypothetical protein
MRWITTENIVNIGRYILPSQFNIYFCLYYISYLTAIIHVPNNKMSKCKRLKCHKKHIHNNQSNTNPSIEPLAPRKQNTYIFSQRHKTNWITSTWSGKEVRNITKLFHDTQTKRAFWTPNTIQSIKKHHSQTDNRSDIYQRNAYTAH